MEEAKFRARKIPLIVQEEHHGQWRQDHVLRDFRPLAALGVTFSDSYQLRRSPTLASYPRFLRGFLPVVRQCIACVQPGQLASGKPSPPGREAKIALTPPQPAVLTQHRSSLRFRVSQ